MSEFPHTLSTNLIIERTADAVIGTMTLGLMRSKGIDPSTLSEHQFRELAFEATSNQCIFAAALTGLYLQASFPGLFSEMFIVQSHVTKNTAQGRREGRVWNFDSWLILREKKSSKYYVLSPALQVAPRKKKLVEVTEGTLEEVTAHVQQELRAWEWPTAQEIRAHESEFPRTVEQFYTYDAATRGHMFQTIATRKILDSTVIDTNPFVLDAVDLL